MELYEAIEKRRTAREFSEKEVGFETIKRILEAANGFNFETVSPFNSFDLNTGIT